MEDHTACGKERRCNKVREIRIITEPFCFVALLSLECTKELNGHGKLRMKGMISRNDAEEYRMLAGKESWVTVKAESETGEQKTFFCGVMTSMELERENELYLLSVTVHTGSFLLDVVPHVRTYQREDYTYREVMQDCLKPDGGKFIMRDKQEAKPDRFLVQYGETDWQFVKRLAGYAGTVVVPEYTVPGKNIYFGYRNAGHTEINADSYCLVQSNKGKRQWKFEIKSREIYSPGDSVRFKDREWVIGKAVSLWKGQQLEHAYTLHSKEGGLVPAGNNCLLRGISMKALVTDVAGTKVQVCMQEDENKERTGHRWFDFATVYSVPGGTGWYCMPEKGDEVRVSFPDADEGNAYAASCVHLESEERTDPNEKSWKNKQGKEILFTPGSLILRNNQGLSVELSDREGIKIVSDKDIAIQAEGDIRMDSRSGGIHMSASENMTISQGGACIQMRDAINISGGKIYMN